MLTDSISDMIIRLKNAGMAKRPTASFPASNLKLAVAEKLKQVGYLKSVSKRGKKVQKTIEVELLYHNGKPKIEDVLRVSRPSQRLYHRATQIRSVRQGHGVGIYSTPQGLLTDKEARAAKVGGELLFKIW